MLGWRRFWKASEKEYLKYLKLLSASHDRAGAGIEHAIKFRFQLVA